MAAGLAPSPPPSPSPTVANTTHSVVEAPAVSPQDEVQSWSDKALEAVNRLTDDMERIKWKANRVSFDVLHDYGDQYGFYRLVLSYKCHTHRHFCIYSKNNN